MAIFDPKNIPVISKLTIGDKTYYLKDAEARELLATLGTAAKKDSIAVALNQTATLAKSAYSPAGTIAADVTATGKVSIAKDAENGVQISGSVSAPTVTVTPATDSIKKVTSVGTLPTKAADIFTANGDDTFTAGSGLRRWRNERYRPRKCDNR